MLWDPQAVNPTDGLSQIYKSKGDLRRKVIGDDQRKYKAVWEALQLTLEQKDEMAHELADRVLDRFVQDCKRCIWLQQVCNFPENSHICTRCTTDVVRCTGDADWDDLDLMWNAADPLEQEMDEFLLNNLPNPAVFQKVKNDEAHIRERRQPYSERSGLSAQEQQDLSRLNEEYQQVRQSLQRIRTDSFGNNIAYQERLLLREVLTICGNEAVRWWSEYDVELDEWTGYSTQRDLPSVENMTETQFRDAVAWVQAHPLYKYDGSIKDQ